MTEKPTRARLGDGQRQPPRNEQPTHNLLERLGVWTETWRPPGSSPVEYLTSIGFLDSRVLVVHGVQFDGDDLRRLRAMGITLVMIVGVIPAAYALAAAASRRFLTRPSRLKILNRTAGTMMIGTGVTVVAR